MTIFKQLKARLAPKINIKDESYLYFGGTAYLGIPQNEEFLQYYLEGIREFGLNNGTSRSNNVQLGIYDEAENVAAQRFGADSALITSSGYLAAQLTVKHFSKWGTVLYAPATHPALWLRDSPQIEGTFTAWANQTVSTINQSQQKRWILISNSLNNLFPELYDFSFINEIDQDKEILLIVDDSHGIGITNNGLGCYTTLPKANNIKTIVLASMAKALGVDAGLVLGEGEFIAELKKTNIFLGASPPAAAGLVAFMNSAELYKKEENKLRKLTAYLEAGLPGLEAKMSFVKDFPVYLSGDKMLADKLLENKILISSFAYPDQNGDLLNRIVLSSWHTEADLDLLLKVL